MRALRLISAMLILQLLGHVSAEDKILQAELDAARAELKTLALEKYHALSQEATRAEGRGSAGFLTCCLR